MTGKDNSVASHLNRSGRETIKLFLLLLVTHYKAGKMRGILRLLYALSIRPHSLGGNIFSSSGKKKHECPCCGYTGSRFLPHISTSYCIFNHVCPHCLAHSRHRSHLLLYRDYLAFEGRKGTLLYIAPEQSNFPFFQKCSGIKLETSDYQADGSDYRFGESDHNLNLMEINLDDERFDYIICHHVIEHVPNDRSAMSGLLRILKKGGLLILSVPMGNSEKTIEYNSPNPLEENHFYRFGRDFIDRIPKSFNVTTWCVQEHVDASLMKKYGLEPDTIYLCERSS